MGALFEHTTGPASGPDTDPALADSGENRVAIGLRHHLRHISKPPELLQGVPAFFETGGCVKGVAAGKQNQERKKSGYGLHNDSLFICTIRKYHTPSSWKCGTDDK